MFASAAPPLRMKRGSSLGPRERVARDAHDVVAPLEAVAAVRPARLDVGTALARLRGERDRLEHLLHELREARLVVRARLPDEPAVVGDDVHGDASLDHADVRGRLLVDLAEPEVGDRARRGRDRVPALLGMHPGVRGAAVERHVEHLGVRRAEDDVADRRSLVVDEPDARDELRLVERAGADAARSPPSA